MILCLSGKKQSGKGTLYKFIEACNLAADIPCQEFLFAGKLKEMCRDILGVPHDQIYGSDAQKSMPVPHLLWENFPLPVYQWPCGAIYIHRASERYPFQVISDPERPGSSRFLYMQPTEFIIGTEEVPQDQWPSRKVGPMTGREVLQYWGTEIFRRQNPNVWVEACLREIDQSDTHLWDGICAITDGRFPGEIEGVKEAGGRSLRLTRSVFDDPHESELALDPDVFDWKEFDGVIDNSQCDAKETCLLAYPVLRDWDCVPGLCKIEIDEIISEVLS